MLAGSDSLCDEIIDDRFRVVCPVGRGGMGVVWRVQHVHTNQLFALKTLCRSAVQRRGLVRHVLHEARATAAVQSKHVVRIVDVNPHYVHRGVDLPFIVMELLEGESLSGLLETRGYLDATEMLWVMRQVSKGLCAVHDCGIVHRDLKPSNVFLSRDEEGDVVAKLCDFGIAKLHGSALAALGETGTLSTETGVMLGTPRYMAPEQLRRHQKLSPATDEWAFAQIAFRALSGRTYFEDARSAAELILAIANDPLPLPSSLSQRIPKSFDDWFLRSCARDPADRFDDVALQYAELERALGSFPPKPIAISSILAVDVKLATSQIARTVGPSVVEQVLVRGSRNAWLHRSFLVLAAGFAAAGTRYLPHLESSSVGVPTSRLVGNAPLPSFTTPTVPSSGPVRDETPRNNAILLPAPQPTTARSTHLSHKKAARTLPREVSLPSNTAALLPRGAGCTRSSQCAEGLCAAEVCQ